MVSVNEHKRLVDEFDKEINEKIRLNNIKERQEIIGFASSEGSINCLAILLHEKNLISSGFNLNHRWFRSEKIAEQYFPFSFPKKEKIIELLIKQENLRNRLCYGRSRDIQEIKDSIDIFFKIKEIVYKEVGYGKE